MPLNKAKKIGLKGGRQTSNIKNRLSSYAIQSSKDLLINNVTHFGEKNILSPPQKLYRKDSDILPLNISVSSVYLRS